MATLEKRVQVLFDPERYRALEAEARATNNSVGSLIRDAVDEYLERHRRTALAALDRLWDHADSLPPTGPIDWDEEKRLIEESYERGVE